MCFFRRRPEAGSDWPRWQDEWREGAHTDVQLTRSDWNATPRRNRMEIWWWLTDVEADRGAMRIMPGSMNTVMDHFEQELSPQEKVLLVLIIRKLTLRISVAMPFLSLKMIILPRQARDKHMENSKKRDMFLQAALPRVHGYAPKGNPKAAGN